GGRAAVVPDESEPEELVAGPVSSTAAVVPGAVVSDPVLVPVSPMGTVAPSSPHPPSRPPQSPTHSTSRMGRRYHLFHERGRAAGLDGLAGEAPVDLLLLVELEAEALVEAERVLAVLLRAGADVGDGEAVGPHGGTLDERPTDAEPAVVGTGHQAHDLDEGLAPQRPAQLRVHPADHAGLGALEPGHEHGVVGLVAQAGQALPHHDLVAVVAELQ